MGLCHFCLRVSGASSIAVLAVLAYFHIECVRESETEDVARAVFRPDVTDVTDVPLNFCLPGQEVEMSFGLDYMFSQWCPCAVMKLLSFLTGGGIRGGIRYETSKCDHS